MISDSYICKVAIPSEYLLAGNEFLSDCSKQLRFVHRNKAISKGFTIKYEYRNSFKKVKRLVIKEAKTLKK